MSSYQLQFAPIEFDKPLPVRLEELWEQSDAPIHCLHYHDCLELGYCHAGNGIFVVGDKVLPFGAGDVVFIASGEVHLARSSPETTSRWTWIYLDPVRLVAHPSAALCLNPAPLSGSNFANILGAAHPEFAPIILSLIDELSRKPAEYEMAVQALVWRLMILAQRISPHPATESPRADFARLAPALQRLSQDGAAKLSCGELAQMCNLSESHFRRIFHRTLGRSPRDYGFDVRMSLAASLLKNTPLSILQVSHETGFDTLSSFNRLFKKNYGMSPREWRQQ